VRDHGGFEHNAQTLRIVDIIEAPYPDSQGLNLLYETRLGFGRHESDYDKPRGGGFPELVCSIEGQIASMADRIAYNCHDLEDGLRLSADCIIDVPQLWELEIVRQASRDIDVDRIKTRYVRNIRISKAIINALVVDVIDTAKADIEAKGIRNLDDVYGNPVVVRLSERGEKNLARLELFLRDNMYFSEYLRKVGENVRVWLGNIMDRYISNPDGLPEYYRGFIEKYGLERAVCDYVSGMTDRFAMKTANER
jgi:dGTPase